MINRSKQNILNQTTQRDWTLYIFIFLLLNLILLQDLVRAIESENLIRTIGCAALVPIWIYLGLKEIRKSGQKTL